MFVHLSDVVFAVSYGIAFVGYFLLICLFHRQIFVFLYCKLQVHWTHIILPNGLWKYSPNNGDMKIITNWL